MANSLLGRFRAFALLVVGVLLFVITQSATARALSELREEAENAQAAAGRERISLNADWRFSRFTSNPDSLSYNTLKNWILPIANDFIRQGTQHPRPSGTPPANNVDYAHADFDDSAWEALDLPHDWAVKGPFNSPGISGGMGRLPVNGVGWYRKTVTLAKEDLEKTIYLDIDGAMSYSAVWLNGNLTGGWPFGYNSFRLDMTRFAKEGENQLAIRLDNAVDSSRWYPGAGIYRNVWLVKVHPVHVHQYGTYVSTSKVSAQSATVNLAVEVGNTGSTRQEVNVESEVYLADPATGKPTGEAVATFAAESLSLLQSVRQTVNGSVTIENPQLWGPAPNQKPNMYIAVTTVSVGDTAIDIYETPFGIRSIIYDANKGLIINDEAVYVQGVCNHHDLGSIGAAFNTRAAERQLEILGEMGTNALRTSHNPPAPELLELADRMGFLVYDEIFDAWTTQKTRNDYHLLFSDWHEPDLRSFIRRDRNHPSVIAWGIGNEIPEQSSSQGGAIARELRDIIRSEDLTRPVTAAMNNANGNTALAGVLDLEGLNYQGEGQGTSNNSAFPGFHSAQPNKMIWTSESSSVLSTRGTYIFPVTMADSATVGTGSGGNPGSSQVSAYELYATSWGSSPDKVFRGQDKYDYVAGEFVWTGFDYIGEPTPYDSSRSSYFGIVDMAGFKKDRFYLYQSRWRADLPMAHILPHWTWPDRVGQVTPVHVFTSGDEAELFVNGKSAGRKKRAPETYRFRWDDVEYAPGELHVVTYKAGKEWATDTKKTAGAAANLKISADRTDVAGNGHDLSFVSIAIVDGDGNTVPQASNNVTFSITGPGKILSTDNGNPADFTVFPSPSRKAFSGLVLAIVQANAGASGDIVVSASSPDLPNASVTLHSS
ncbi:glycoside hydrolase family 2 protein [Astrocystis sublimbata]|nr:glycoside hydrolase family 2 protein [Astrocystis sublimbata]